MAYIKTPEHIIAKSEHISIATLVEEVIYSAENPEDVVSSVVSFCANLTDLLVDKGLVTAEEVGNLLNVSLS